MDKLKMNYLIILGFNQYVFKKLKSGFSARPKLNYRSSVRDNYR